MSKQLTNECKQPDIVIKCPRCNGTSFDPDSEPDNVIPCQLCEGTGIIKEMT